MLFSFDRFRICHAEGEANTDKHHEGANQDDTGPRQRPEDLGVENAKEELGVQAMMPMINAIKAAPPQRSNMLTIGSSLYDRLLFGVMIRPMPTMMTARIPSSIATLAGMGRLIPNT